MNTAKNVKLISHAKRSPVKRGTLRAHFEDLSNFGLSIDEQREAQGILGWMDAALLDADCPGSCVCGVAITKIVFAAAKFIVAIQETGGDATGDTYFRIYEAVKDQCNVIYFG